jgi:hypothetical protein
MFFEPVDLNSLEDFISAHFPSSFWAFNSNTVSKPYGDFDARKINSLIFFSYPFYHSFLIPISTIILLNSSFGTKSIRILMQTTNLLTESIFSSLNHENSFHKFTLITNSRKFNPLTSFKQEFNSYWTNLHWEPLRFRL